MTEAREHLKYEEYQKAIPYIDQLLDQEPDNPFYNFWMGKCLYYSYKKNMALAFFDKVNGINPEVDRDFHYFYALTLHYNYEFDRAMQEYRLALENYRPKSLEYLDIQKRVAQSLYGRKAMENKNLDWDRIYIENSGPTINSQYAEHSPVVSANDSILLYTARRPESLGAIPEEHFYDKTFTFLSSTATSGTRDSTSEGPSTRRDTMPPSPSLRTDGPCTSTATNRMEACTSPILIPLGANGRNPTRSNARSIRSITKPVSA